VSRSDYFATADDLAGRLWIPCGCGVSVSFMLHHDAKTAPGVRVEPSGRAVAVVANAFPLPAGPLDVGGSCPGVTSECRNCYAAGLESWAPSFRRGAAGNLAGLRHLYGCGGVAAVASALVDLVRLSERRQRVRGVVRPAFRWHSDGDVFADWYARAIVRAVNATPGVEHWAYTRTLSAVAILKRARGLSLYVSADRANLLRAGRVAARHGVPVALLATDRADAAALWARLGASVPGAVGRGASCVPVTCPASGKWAGDGLDVPAHVVGADGRRASARRGAPGVGACIACRVCLPSGSGRPVTFLVHGGQARGDSGGRLGAAVTVRRRDVAVTL
jgi:hypothetical protein